MEPPGVMLHQIKVQNSMHPGLQLQNLNGGQYLITQPNWIDVLGPLEKGISQWNT